MLKNGLDYKWESDKGLSISWRGEWHNIKLPEYRPDELIAAGANGITYKAFHNITKRYAVIKVWMPGKVNLKSRFLKEVRKIAQLNHNSIVTLYDGRILPSGFYIAIYEYVQGKSLDEWLNNNPDVDERLAVCRKILQAVYYYQDKGVFHGDLHSKNILISLDGDPTIIDFGSSVFSEKSFTKDRELYLLTETVTSLLKPCKAFCKKHFAFTTALNPHPHIQPISGELFAFSFEPILLTETMQQYVELMDMMEHLKKFDLEDIQTFANFLSKSSYLNVDFLLTYTAEHYISPKQLIQFVSVVDENIFYETFPENCDENGLADKLLMSSFMAYCVMAKFVSPPFINVIDEKNIISEDQIQAKKYNEVINALSVWLATTDQFFRVTSKLRIATKESDYKLYDMARATLYYSLERYFEGKKILFSYWIGAKTREILREDNYPDELKKAITFLE